MEVTRDNFKHLYPIIENEIKNCDYLAIDCEFTGIQTGYLNLFDDQQERYFKKLKNEMKYEIVQFGLSIFKKNHNNIIESNCYNFYIFKYHIENSILKGHEILLNCSAFEFLSNNGFDFNKLFRNGITYCNIDEEQKLRASIDKKDNELLLNERTDYDKQKIIYEALIEFNQFMSSDKIRLELGPYEKSKLNLIKKTIEEANKNRKNSASSNLGLKTNGLNLSIDVRCEKNTNYWKLELVKDLKDNEFKFNYKEITNDCIGFSKIIQSIIEFRKPIVGHNVLLDIMHIINQFISNLPSNYNDFQLITNELFPLIYDTKHMSVFLEELNKQRVKSLEDLFIYFKKKYPNHVNKIKLMNSIDLKNELEKNLTIENNDNKLRFHQAGYDSYITGVCFYVFKSLVEEKSNKSIYEDSRFRNKFFNARSIDIPFLTTEENQDVKLDRKNIFFVEFNCDPIELENFFKNLDYRIEYLDFKTCLIGFSNNNSTLKEVYELINENRKSNDNKFKIKSYNEYKKDLINQERPLKRTKLIEESNLILNNDIQINSSKNITKSNLISKPNLNSISNNSNSLITKELNNKTILDRKILKKSNKKVFEEENDWCETQ